MYSNEKFKRDFLGVLYSESIYIVLILIATGIITSINDKISSILGDPSGIGFGWGMILGGWTLYTPIVFIVLTLFCAFIVSIIFRNQYLKSYLNFPMDENKYISLLILSWGLYLIVPLILLSDFFGIINVIVSVGFLIIDISILYFCYFNLAKIELE